MPFGPLPAFSPPPLFGSETLSWVVFGLLVYWAAVVVIRNAGLFPSYVGTQGPILTFHTKRGRDFLDWVAGPKRFWRAWANFGIGISLVVMVAMFGFLLFAAISALLTPEPASTGVQQPRNVLVIPGVNDFLPLSATPGIVFGLLVGLVVHEGGHGLLCRVEDIEIESMGVAMLAVIPFGAFVEPNQESSRAASRGGQTRMFAAGVTNNFAITLLAFAILFGPIAGSIAVAPGAAVGGVAPGSPAADAGIEPNDRITAIDGESVGDHDELRERLATIDAGTIEVELDGDRTVAVERSLLVTAAIEDGPTSLEIGDRILAVDGESVSSVSAFRSAVGDDPVVDVTAERDGEEHVRTDVPIGALVTVGSDGPLANGSAPADEPLVITEFDDERIVSSNDLDDVLSATSPGDEVVVEAVVGGELESYTVTLGDSPFEEDTGFLGINQQSGISGVQLDDLGIQPYPAEEFLVMLGGEGEGSFEFLTDSFLGKIGIALLLPIFGVLGVLPFNFAGFAGGIQNFYEVQGSLAALGDGTVFFIANLLFWTGWINVQLGFFNLIPAFPLDGGHILRTSTEAILSRLPFDATRGMVRIVTTSVGVTMLVSFLAMVFVPTLLAG